MARNRLRYQVASRSAEDLVDELGISKLPVDPFQIAQQHNIVVKPKPSDEAGVSGFLMKLGDNFGIMYATHIKNEGFIRFTVSHELGHFFLPGHPEHVFAGGKTVHASRSGFTSSDPYELEADHFAASLLMPTRLFVAAMDEAGEGFPAIELLATTCKTSLTATAIRFANHTDDPVAVIVSQGDHIDYCWMSEVLKDVRGIEWIQKGELLPTGSETRRFNADPENVRQARKVEAWTKLDDWFDRSPDLEMKEDVVGLGTYGKTLTVLFADEVRGDEEDEW